jgi:hypothetical protein
MPLLSHKKRLHRALTDLTALNLIPAVKRRIADQMLVCPPQDMAQLRQQATLADTFIAELRLLVNSGELDYDGNSAK